MPAFVISDTALYWHDDGDPAVRPVVFTDAAAPDELAEMLSDLIKEMRHE